MARIREVERAIKQQLDLAGLSSTHTLEKNDRQRHWLIRDSNGHIVVSVPHSPGDQRWLKHLRCDIRRAARKYQES